MGLSPNPVGPPGLQEGQTGKPGDRPWWIGLTGGIGSGKSTVTRLLQSLGAHCVDTDAISRQLTAAGGAAMPGLAEHFGPQALQPDGSLNRERMRQWAFSDPKVKAALQALLHPLIVEEAWAQARRATAPVVVFDVPLLVESGRWAQWVDQVWVVDCDEHTQAQRVMARSGWSEAQVRAVMAQQASRSQRRALAHAVIDNQGPASALEPQVRALYEALLGQKPEKSSPPPH